MNARVSWFAGTPQAMREAKVDAGLAFFDQKFGREKVNGLDLDRLDIGDWDNCPVAQLTGKRYSDEVLRELGLKDNVAAEKIGCYSVWQASSSSRHEDAATLMQKDDIERCTAIYRQKINQRRNAAA